MGRDVRVVGFEFNILLRLGEAIQHDSVIDGDSRKTEQVHERHAALVQRAFQFFRHLFLKPSVNPKNHAPVTAHKIRLPRAAQFRFEQRLARLTERAQAVVTGNHKPF